MNPRIPYRMSSERENLAGPGGKKIIVQFVVNVEYWPFDRPMPRSLLPAPHGGKATPDVPNFSWVDYGMRNGLPRFLEILGDHPVSVAINASVLESYPSAAAAMHAAGWEFLGHGFDQVALHSVDDEPGTLERALAALEHFTGRRPRGWLGSGLQETDDTPDLLKSLGIEYVLDWVIDDLPNWMTTVHGPLASLPYSLELNDSLLHAVQQQPSDEMLRRVARTLDVFEHETRDGGCRVMTVPLHPHLMGVPHRIQALEQVVDLVTARDDTVIVDGSQMFDWFAEVAPAT